MQDAESVAGEVFACGLTLEEISAYTVDSNNKRTFVSRQALDHLRKVRPQLLCQLVDALAISAAIRS
jgi:hypothetical protein